MLFRSPIMIHRAILGSFERFFGTLVEHYAGAFPLWLAPVQILLIPIREEQVHFTKEVKDILQNQGFRVIMDARNETLDKRIREGSLKKIPYLVIIGEKEMTQRTVALRKRGVGDGGVLSIDDFVKQLQQEQHDKTA